MFVSFKTKEKTKKRGREGKREKSKDGWIQGEDGANVF